MSPVHVEGNRHRRADAMISVQPGCLATMSMLPTDGQLPIIRQLPMGSSQPALRPR